MKQTAKLYNWSLVEGGDVRVLLGHVKDHPRLEDGTYVQTSLLVSLDEARGKAETLNTIYTLIGD